MKRSIRHALLAGAMLFACGSIAERASAQQDKIFELTSSTFKDGQMMPKRVSGRPDPSNANCVGEDMSPEFSWANPPAGTKSFAFLAVDPEGRGGSGVIHWVAYGIPADVTSLAEGEASKQSSKFVGGKNSRGTGTLMGPCAPGNVQAHHYTYVIIATDLDPKALPPGLTRDEFLAKLRPSSGPGHDKGTAGIVGLFRKPSN